ncbi:hypothetical protein [Argonema antarcticum]|uniref:hypothetical protein n=1 Tax=Argonema antarcticum TaxID=2942763 RepID=UPI002011CCF0|nr:hypothetical protein [Argonema antarcticum]MCL1471000.1 hypothetical protein [Argonema antarcticum A004/B2]
MEWLLVIGVGILVVSIGTVIYAKSKKSRRIQPGTGEIRWRDIGISPPRQPNRRNINVSPVTEEIEWIELEVDLPPTGGDGETIIDENFLNPDVPDDLDNILRNVIGTKDLYSQEIFRPGERVYLCRRHKLAYHEDSWRELGCQCPVCGNAGHTGEYTLPVSIQFPQTRINRDRVN